MFRFLKYGGSVRDMCTSLTPPEVETSWLFEAELPNAYGMKFEVLSISLRVSAVFLSFQDSIPIERMLQTCNMPKLIRAVCSSIPKIKDAHHLFQHK